MDGAPGKSKTSKDLREGMYEKQEDIAVEGDACDLIVYVHHTIAMQLH